MKRVLITVLFLGLVIHAFTQTYKGKGGAFTLGVQSITSDKLPLISDVSPDFDNVGFNFGGYTYWQLNRVTFGLKGYGLAVRPFQAGDYKYNLYGGAILGELGYKVLYTEKHALYPFAGIGFGGVNFNVNDTRNVELDPDPSAPVLNSGNYRMGTLVYDFGFRWEAFLFFDENEASAGLIGLEAGYQLSAAGNNWSTEGGGNVSGYKEGYVFDGWYVKLALGGFEGFFEK